MAAGCMGGGGWGSLHTSGGLVFVITCVHACGAGLVEHVEALGKRLRAAA